MTTPPPPLDPALAARVEEKNERRKCEVVLKPPYRLEPCKFMNELVQEPGRRGAGLFVWQKSSMVTYKPTREAWVLKSGDYAKNGMHINFCPMCGTDIRGLFTGLFEKEPTNGNG
jgi:hypothetical protein